MHQTICKRALTISYLVIHLLGFSYGTEKPNLIFREPNKEELLMRRWVQDTSAEAAFLYEKEDIQFLIAPISGEYQIQTTYHCRLKIFKNSGFDRGTIKIRLKKRDQSEEFIDNIRGATYNYENGNIVTSPLNKELIFKESISDYESITKLTAPNLKEGSIFEYSYTKTTPFSITANPRTWLFQGTIPFKWSEVSIVIPKRFLYKLFFSGYLPMCIHEEKDTVVNFGTYVVSATKYHYAVKDAPAFVYESYTNTYKDYISKLEFECARYKDPSSDLEIKYSVTWHDIHKTLSEYEYFGEKIDKNSFLKETATQFELLDTLEKVKAAFRYISKTMKWDGSFQIYSSESLSKVFGNKVGSGAQINMILVALLRYLKVNANPAIISTIDNGEINQEYALLEKFNYCIAQVRIGGEDILMDATQKFSYPNLLPYYCLSKKAFVIEKEQGRFIFYQPKVKMVSMEMMDYVIHPQENEVKGNFKASYGGYYALTERNYIDQEGEAKELDKIKEDNPDWQLENIKIEKKDSIYEPLEIRYDFSSALSNQGEEAIYFNPLFAHRYHQNPFKDTLRIYPVDFNIATENIIIVSIKIPEGYKIENIPKSEHFALPDKAGKFTYVVELQNDVLKIKSHFVMNKTYFLPYEYNNLRKFYTIVADKQAQQVTLKKL